jgi:uncharacterized protein (DUF1684 family)
LDYFDPDPAYRFELELAELDDKQSVTAETTADSEREYVAWGEFRFGLDGEQRMLRAFRHVGDDSDGGSGSPSATRRTAGRRTAPTGTSTSTPTKTRPTTVGGWSLQPRLQPFCAYSAAYECPLVPVSNWLETRTEAGERSYEGAERHGA